jgi:hypothetical protein
MTSAMEDKIIQTLGEALEGVIESNEPAAFVGLLLANENLRRVLKAQAKTIKRMLNDINPRNEMIL